MILKFGKIILRDFTEYDIADKIENKNTKHKRVA